MKYYFQIFYQIFLISILIFFHSLYKDQEQANDQELSGTLIAIRPATEYGQF